MPTIFSHAAVAVITGRAFLDCRVSFWFWLLVAVCAMIPDADVITRSFGVPRGSMFAHRGFTHSIFFAVLFGTIAALIARKFLRVKLSLLKLAAFFAVATFSHPLLDMLTDGGSGAALFAPFSNERFFFPWRPVEVSPIGLGFFSQRGWAVITSEFVWLWLPSIAVLILATLARKLRKN